MWGRFTVILVVAVLLGGCGDDGAVSEVTGETSCVQTESTWSGPALGGAPGTSEEVSYDCDYILSDERVSGTGPAVASVDVSVNGDTTVGQISGTVIISNEGGTWEGTMSGTTTWTPPNPAHMHVMDAVYLGTGDYEGLRFVMTNEGTDTSHFTTTGRIEPAE